MDLNWFEQLVISKWSGVALGVIIVIVLGISFWVFFRSANRFSDQEDQCAADWMGVADRLRRKTKASSLEMSRALEQMAEAVDSAVGEMRKLRGPSVETIFHNLAKRLKEKLGG